MKEYTFEICTLAVLLFGFCAYKFYHYRLKDNLFKKISWCVRTSVYSTGRTLYEELLFHSGQGELYEQHLEQMTDKRYALDINNGTEKEMVKKILNDYQMYLSGRYFNQSLECSRLICRLDEFHYFILTLLNYLHDKVVCKTIAGENIRGKELEHTSYGSWGHPLYDATYELTDFGIVFIKLLYMIRSYAETAPAFKGMRIRKIAHKYKETIDNKVIKISSV